MVVVFLLNEEHKATTKKLIFPSQRMDTCRPTNPPALRPKKNPHFLNRQTCTYRATLAHERARRHRTVAHQTAHATPHHKTNAKKKEHEESGVKIYEQTSDIAATKRLSRAESAAPLPGRAPHRFHALCLPHPSHPVCGTRSVLGRRRRQFVHSKKRRVALTPFWVWPRSLQRLLKRLRFDLHCVDQDRSSRWEAKAGRKDGTSVSGTKESEITSARV